MQTICRSHAGLICTHACTLDALHPVDSDLVSTGTSSREQTKVSHVPADQVVGLHVGLQGVDSHTHCILYDLGMAREVRLHPPLTAGAGRHLVCLHLCLIHVALSSSCHGWSAKVTL